MLYRIRVDLIEDNRESGRWTRDLLHRLINQATKAELDRRYWAYVETLPPRLAPLATDRRSFKGQGPSQPLQSIGEIGFPAGMPWMFRDAFPGLEGEKLLDVSEAWLFVLLALLLRDHAADGQVAFSPDVEELRQRLMSRARSAFRPLVGSQPAFWRRFEGYEQQVVSALRLEAHYRVSPGPDYDLARAWQIGCGKSALGKTVPCVMAVLSGDLSPLPRLELSMDALVAGRQLLDDVCDWQEDLARGHYAYPLAQAVVRLKEAGMAVTPQAIEDELNASTIREEALSQSRIWHQQALAALDGISCQGWTDLVKHSLTDCVSYHVRLIFYHVAQAAREQRHSVPR